MSSKKFDSKATLKLLSNYKTTISKFTEDNSSLSAKLTDLKTTLELNQSLLVNFITSTIGESPQVKELLFQTRTLWQENEQLLKDKNDLEMKTFKLQEIIEDTPMEIREELALVEKKNTEMKQLLVQKDSVIKKLKADLEKARRNALFKNPRTEILVTDPTSANVEINHELLYTKSILEKVTSMHTDAKTKADKLDKEVKVLQSELASLRKTTKENDNNTNNDCITQTVGSSEIENKIKSNNKRPQLLTTSNKPISIAKLNLGQIKKQDKEQIKDENKVSSSSSHGDDDKEDSMIDSIDKRFKNKAKTKQKELELLQDEYNNLKNQNDEYEKKIEKYKRVYKDMKEKIQNLTSLIQYFGKSDNKEVMDPTTTNARTSNIGEFSG